MNEHIRSFAFHRSFFNFIQKLESNDDRLLMYDAITHYVFFGEIPDFSDKPILEIAWGLIVPNLDSSIRKAKAGANSGGERPSMRGNQNARKNEKEEHLKNNTETTQEHLKNNRIIHDNSSSSSSSLNNEDNSRKEVVPTNTDLNGGIEVGRTRESWRALSSVRKDVLGWNKDAIAEYKKELLRQEVVALGVLTEEGIEAFVSKWGEHNPGEEMIRAEREDIFNVAERVKNYAHIGRTSDPNQAPKDDDRFEEGKDYWLKSFTIEDLIKMDFEIKRHIQRNGAVKRVNGKWVID